MCAGSVEQGRGGVFPAALVLAERISRQNMRARGRGGRGHCAEEISRQNIKLRWVLLVVSEARLRLTLNILSNLGQTAAAECRLC